MWILLNNFNTQTTTLAPTLLFKDITSIVTTTTAKTPYPTHINVDTTPLTTSVAVAIELRKTLLKTKYDTKIKYII